MSVDKLAKDEEKTGGVEILKLVLLGLAGGIVGAVPYVVLPCASDNYTVLLMLLCGAGSLAFYLALGHGKIKGPMPHIICVLDTVAASVLANFVLVMVHWTNLIPWDAISPLEPMNIFQKLGYYLSYEYNNPESTPEGLNFYVVLITGAVVAVLGIYAVMLFIVISDKRKAKKNK